MYFINYYIIESEYHKIAGTTNYNETQQKLRNCINFYYETYTAIKQNTECI